MPISDNAAGIVSDMSFVDAYVKPSTYFVLSGSCLPFRGLRFGITNKHHAQDYQGSNFIHINVTNPLAKDLIMKGRWDGRWLDGTNGEIEYGKDGSIGAPQKKISEDIKTDPFQAMMRFCQWMEEYVSTGPIVDFAWYGISRRGLLCDFEYEITDTNNIMWDMRIVWESHKPVASFAKVEQINGPASIGLDWAQKFKDLVGLLEQALGMDPLQGAYGPNIPVISDIFDVMRDVDTQMRRFNDALASAEKMNELIADGAMRPLEVITNVINSISAMTGTIDRMKLIWEQNSVSHMAAFEYAVDSLSKPSWSTSMPGTSDSGDVPVPSVVYGIPSGTLKGSSGDKTIQKGTYEAPISGVRPGFSPSLDFDVREIINTMKLDASETIQKMKKFQVNYNNIIDIYIADDETHIGTVATKYYGSWDKWIKLADFNGIIDPILQAGRVVMIPKDL